MQTRIVAKFGGTSVKTVLAITQLEKVLKTNITPLIDQESSYAFIIVSAVGGVTNKLIDFCNLATISKQEEKARELIQEIKEIHLDLAKNLGILDLVEAQIIARIKLFEDLKTINPMVVDSILSSGEDLSSLLVTSFLQSKGVSARFLDAKKYMVTDSNFGKAFPNIAAIKVAVAKELEENSVKFIISQGFVGADSDGRVTTLGRGGSDYSAALLAEAIDADKLYIYTDVAGVYTMDPNIVKNARPIEYIGFQEMAEMANFGAKILHPSTLEPCVRAKISVKILSTFEPDKSGTEILLDERQQTSPLVHAITMRKKQILVTIKSLKMLNTYGFLANIFDVLAKHRISVDLINTSEVSVALTIDGAMLGSQEINPFIHNKSLIAEMEKFAEITVEEGLTLIALIGSGLTVTGAIQKMLAKLQHNFVRLICYGASSSSVGILVRSADAEEIAQTLHKELLEIDQN